MSDVSGWQPIATAPTDGRELLVWWPMRAPNDQQKPKGDIPGGFVVVSAWVRFLRPWPVPGTWARTYEVRHGIDWDDARFEFAEAPSHWMPLPEPPAEAAP